MSEYYPFKMVEDYPFTSWSSFYDALMHYLNSADCNLTYPKYCSEGDNLCIIKDLLAAGHSPQEGLDGFIKAFINGNRYGRDYSIETLAEFIKTFIDAGATPNADMLFVPRFDAGYFEDEALKYPIRGILIDALSEFNVDFRKYWDWSSIEGKDWEDIHDTDYHKARHMVLKYHSKHLQTLS